MLGNQKNILKTIAIFCIILLTILTFSCKRGPEENPILTGYVERSKCYTCHEEVYKNYLGSHHDHAMNFPTEKTRYLV